MFSRVIVRQHFRCCFALIVVIGFGLALAACRVTDGSVVGLWSSPAAPFVVEGDRQAAEGRTAEAILAYRQAVERDAHHVSALRKLGHAYASQGRRRLAQSYLQRAAVLRPNDQQIAAELTALQVAGSSDGPLTRVWMVLANAGRPTGMALAEGMLIVALEDGRLIAMDAVSAVSRWESKLPARATSAPTVAAGQVYVGAADGALHALRAGDGQLLWRYQTAAPIYAAALATSDVVYVASGDGSFSSLASADGSLRWHIAAVGPLTGAPALAEGMIYFGAADGRIFGVEAATGREVWGSGIAAQGAVESQPTVADGRVFVGAGDSRLYALDAATGGEYWRYSTPDAIYARPLAISDTVYVASAGKTLTALDALTGEPRWEWNAHSALRHAPVPVGEALYFIAAADPHLYALDARTGQFLWQFDTGDRQWTPLSIRTGRRGHRAAFAINREGSRRHRLRLPQVGERLDVNCAAGHRTGVLATAAAGAAHGIYDDAAVVHLGCLYQTRLHTHQALDLLIPRQT